jgi:hypothetical protein
MCSFTRTVLIIHWWKTNVEVFNADPDPAFYLNADPGPAFYLNEDPDPAFYLTADPDRDPGCQANADLDRSQILVSL